MSTLYKTLILLLFIILLWNLLGCHQESSVIQSSLRRNLPASILNSHIKVGNLLIPEGEPGLDIVLGTSHGSGTVIAYKKARAYILTAHHVVQVEESPIPFSERRLAVKIRREGNWIPARLERVAKNADAAIISFQVPTPVTWRPEPIRLAEREARLGEQVFSIGSAGPLQRFLIPSIVAGFCWEDIQCISCRTGQSCPLLSEPAYGGMSGGMVVNTQGQIVGITIAGIVIRGTNAVAIILGVEAFRLIVEEFGGR